MTSESSAVRTTLGVEALGLERRVHLRAAGERGVVRDDRKPRQRGERQGDRLRERMPARHQHAAVPLVARHGDELREIGQRLGGDADVGAAVRGLLGDLDGIALMQLDLHARKPGGEIADHRRQHVTGLRVRRRDGERAFDLVLEFGTHALHVLDLAQRTARRGDDGLSGRRDGRDALTRPDEHPYAEFVLELAHLLAHPGLRGEERGRRVRHVEAVVGDSAQITQLLEVQGEGGGAG